MFQEKNISTYPSIWMSLLCILMVGCKSTGSYKPSYTVAVDSHQQVNSQCPSGNRRSYAVSERNSKAIGASFEAYARGSIDEAVNKLLALGEVERQYDKAYINRMLGHFYAEKGDFIKGIAYLEKVVDANVLGGQDHAATQTLLANLYLVNGDYLGAIRQYKAQMQFSCHQSETAYSGIAFAYFSLADLDKMYSNTITAFRYSSRPDKDEYISRFEVLKKQSDQEALENLFFTVYPKYKGIQEKSQKKIAKSDAEEKPVPPLLLVRIEPFYPLTAARDEIEGCVEVSFSVNTSGKPINIQVIESKPEGVFDFEAVRAVAKWHYRPQYKSGVPVQADGLTEKLCFKLSISKKHVPENS
ncbi:TonB family protein [Shewanella insulae]|uniref:TonB family protein n=1 Tax=Shewanella insulae TaxID=2681496 RepID=UPI001EFC8B56|nr:TonB family protein [Shewanella insulae]MCG9737065.1 TonB family protein [Shewanella insulae]